MKNNYYDEDKHKYMRPDASCFGDFIYFLIDDGSFSSYDTAIELGAGMGRFSTAISTRFVNIILVEPNDVYAALLEEAFPQGGHLKVVQSTAEAFLSARVLERAVVVFCFHLMHHLHPAQRVAVYEFVRETGSSAIIVEPNPYNPLILLQILLHPDMSVAQEIQYLTLTPTRYANELAQNGLTVRRFKRLCLLPPPVTRILLRILPMRVVARLEVFNRLLPFLASYQLITFGAAR